MKIYQVFLAFLWVIILGCSNNQGPQRALDPWIVRVNLDGRPNMIGLALSEQLFAAYDGKMGGLYKVWKGNINFTGPVFDNLHGPQPTSEGEAYILDNLETSPWLVMHDGQEKPAENSFIAVMP